MTAKSVKLLSLAAFAGMALFCFADRHEFVQSATAYSTGPPAGHTGAPGEVTCAECHENTIGPGTLAITAPQNYALSQTYQIVVRHQSSDTTRQRWGFQLTSLAGTAPAGTLTSIGGVTQVISGAGGRTYIEHTESGTFPGQDGGAVWTFNWTAPATNVGPIKFYAAGNQANNDGNSTGDRILTTNAASQPPVAQPTPRMLFDFDGDGKTDISIFRPVGVNGAEWWYQRSIDGLVPANQFGSATDKVVAADFTGDGKTDIAFFRPSTGQWFILRSEDGSFFAFPFGTNGDIPMPADYDGDGKADAAVFRPSSATWFILRSSDGQVTFTQFGANGDLPVASDYDGDGKADVAIFRPSGANGAEWWVQRSTAGLLALQFGSSTDKAVPGDYTGDGKTDIAFFRPSTGQWYILRSEDFSYFAFPWGANGDIAAPGDYDGDGKFDAAVFRPATSTWYVNRSTAGPLFVGFGNATDQPVPNAYVR